MSTHNICFDAKIRKIIIWIPSDLELGSCFYGKKTTHSKTSLFKYTENFTTKKKKKKKKKIQIKNSDILYISAQNIDCGYSLELLQRGGSNVYPQSMFLNRNKISAQNVDCGYSLELLQ